MNKIRKGFTLIEMIVVLVIVAIVSLIAIPFVLQINDKVKIESNKRSVDAYGKALELANIEYKLDHGYYSYDIDELNVKYNGDKVKCDEVVINNDGTVYLKKCKIGDEYVEDNKNHYKYYQYGKKEVYYHIGDEVYYDNMKFYVIRNGYLSDKYVTLIKAEPVDYTDLRNITVNTELYYMINKSGYNYAYISYFASTDHCHKYWNNVNNPDYTECKNDYSTSLVKRYVDLWVENTIGDENLLNDENGYKKRLITKDELFDVFSFNLEYFDEYGIHYYSSKSELFKKIFPDRKGTWTMTSYDDSKYQAYYIEYFRYSSSVLWGDIWDKNPIRPVINLKVSAMESE